MGVSEICLLGPKDIGVAIGQPDTCHRVVLVPMSRVNAGVVGNGQLIPAGPQVMCVPSTSGCADPYAPTRVTPVFMSSDK